MRLTPLAVAPFASRSLVAGARGRLHPLGRHAFALIDTDETVVWADVRADALSPRGITLAALPPFLAACAWSVDETQTLHAEGFRLALAAAPRVDLADFSLAHGALRPLHRLDVVPREHLFDVALDAAETRFRSAFATPDLLPAARALVGLGPGLTPSGDDLLGGLLLALHGLASAPPGLAEAVLDEARTATHPIARARLADHAMGFATRTEIALLRALSAPEQEPFARAVASLRRFGHHSGDDFLRGVAMGVEFFSRGKAR